MYKTLSAPLTVQIEITNSCTDNCVHCYNFWRNSNNGSKAGNFFLSEGDVKIIMRKLADANVFDIIITGGEPLLNKKGVIACLKEANRFRMNVSLNSNLMPLDPRYAQELRDLGIEYILTSVLGPNAMIHDSITQRKGSFEKTIKNIKLAIEEGIGIITNMVITKPNLGYIKETALFVKSLGVKKFVATKASCPGNCTDFSSFVINMAEFRGYLHDLYMVEKELNMRIDALESYPLCGIKEINTHKEITNRRCLAGITACTIASDGSMRPCSHLDMSYGNLLKEDIYSIWKKMEEWRIGKFLPYTCKQCSLLALCGGGCRIEAKTRYGDLSAMDPYSSPKDVKFCRHLIKLRKKKQPGNLAKNINYFMLNDIRWRKEIFGAIIAVNKKTHVFLNHEGTSVFRQFRKNYLYTLDDNKINWESLDPALFVAGLSKRGVISLKERR